MRFPVTTLLCALLLGCAALPTSALQTQRDNAAEKARKPRTAIAPWLSIAEGWLEENPRDPPTGFFRLTFPTAVAAGGGFVYVVDSGSNQVVRYDTMSNRFFAFKGVPAAPGTRIQVAPDSTVYVFDQVQKRILHFGRDGALLRTLDNIPNLANPGDMVYDESRGRFLIYDKVFKRFLVVRLLGLHSDVLPVPDDRFVLQSVVSFALGPEGLYVLDAGARQVVVIGPEGGIKYAFGAGLLHDPTAIAVDRYNRVYVADRQDGVIRVFHSGTPAGTIPGTRPKAPAWQVNALAVGDSALFVSDSLNRRIEAFRLLPP